MTNQDSYYSIVRLQDVTLSQEKLYFNILQKYYYYLTVGKEPAFKWHRDKRILSSSGNRMTTSKIVFSTNLKNSN